MSIKPRQWAKQHTSTSNTFEFNDTKWKVMGSNGGLDRRHLSRVFQQVDVMLTKYSKVCIIQFDLHMLEYTDDNKKMKIFKRRLFGRVARKYKINEKNIGYFWCREYEKGKGQYYHWAVIVDGRKVPSGFKINNFVKEVWQAMDGTVHWRNHHNISRTKIEKQRNAMEHLSYLTKIRTKGYAGYKVKSFSSSKIQYPDGDINNKKGLCSQFIND